MNFTPSPAEGFLMRKNAVLFINGDVESYDFIDEYINEKTFLVAVDGGLRHVLDLDLLPQLLIGDLDSVSPEQIDFLTGKGVEIKRFPVEKNETDLELALIEAVKRGYTEIFLVGALGGRIDQCLANLFLLQMPELAATKVIVVDEAQELFVIRGQAQFSGQPGDMVSLLPLTDCAEGVTTRGLRYPLSNETLYPDRSRGISNEMLESSASVALSKGILLCVHSWTQRKERK